MPCSTQITADNRVVIELSLSQIVINYSRTTATRDAIKIIIIIIIEVIIIIFCCLTACDVIKTCMKKRLGKTHIIYACLPHKGGSEIALGA